MEIVKIIAVAVIGTSLISLTKKNNNEYTLPIELAVITVVLFFVLKYISEIVVRVSGAADAYGVESGYIMLMLKALCISILTELGANICKDNGNSAISSKIELAGKVAIVLLTLPLLEKLIEFAVGLING